MIILSYLLSTYIIYITCTCCILLHNHIMYMYVVWIYRAVYVYVCWPVVFCIYPCLRHLFPWYASTWLLIIMFEFLWPLTLLLINYISIHSNVSCAHWLQCWIVQNPTGPVPIVLMHAGPMRMGPACSLTLAQVHYCDVSVVCIKVESTLRLECSLRNLVLEGSVWKLRRVKPFTNRVSIFCSWWKCMYLRMTIGGNLL